MQYSLDDYRDALLEIRTTDLIRQIQFANPINWEVSRGGEDSLYLAVLSLYGFDYQLDFYKFDNHGNLLENTSRKLNSNTYFGLEKIVLNPVSEKLCLYKKLDNNVLYHQLDMMSLEIEKEALLASMTGFVCE